MSLSLECFSALDDNGAIHLGSGVISSSLTELNLNMTSIGDETIRALKSIRLLHQLLLERTHITDQALLELVHFQNIEILSLGQNQSLTDEGLIAMVDAGPMFQKTLREFNLARTRFGNDVLTSLCQFGGLTQLDLGHTLVEPEKAKRILTSKLKKLTNLRVPIPVVVAPPRPRNQDDMDQNEDNFF